MSYEIKKIFFLRKLLWLDCFIGGFTAIIGLLFYKELTSILGLNSSLILIVSAVTLLYALTAMMLALQKNISMMLLQTIIYANWIWTLVSIALLIIYYDTAHLLGKAFLILQILVVAGLAYLEGKQITKKR